jgi:hypothetical protein
MADEPATPVPVSGVLIRRRADGGEERIALTAEDLESAANHYEPEDLQRIRVTMSNGDQIRPWRFVEMNPQLRSDIDPETGLTTVTIL